MQHIKPRFASKAQMKKIEEDLTARVEAEIKRREAEAKKAVGKSARRPTVADARTAASLRKLDARLTAFEERFRAGRQAAQTERVDEIVRKVAEARAITKSAPRVLAAAGAESFKEMRQLRREVGETAEKLARVAESLTKTHGARAPRRIQ